MRLTPSVEYYLKAIYALTERGEAASTSALAEALDVQPASITGMIKRLADFGYVEHTRYRGVHLTEKGSKAALRVIRRHRILETYLQTHLGFTWDDVHSEAERLEHAASETLIERMATILRHPSHDPHGAPIPTSAGELEGVPIEHGSVAMRWNGLIIHADPVGRAAQFEGLTPAEHAPIAQRSVFGRLHGSLGRLPAVHMGAHAAHGAPVQRPGM